MEIGERYMENEKRYKSNKIKISGAGPYIVSGNVPLSEKIIVQDW